MIFFFLGAIHSHKLYIFAIGTTIRTCPEILSSPVCRVIEEAVNISRILLSLRIGVFVDSFVICKLGFNLVIFLLFVFGFFPVKIMILKYRRFC